MRNYSDEELAEVLDKPIFHQIGEAADSLGLGCYVVGGYVRDLFLDRPSNDIDVVCLSSLTPNPSPKGEGSDYRPGIEVAKKFRQLVGRNAHLSVFRNFGTAQVKIYKEQSPSTPLSFRRGVGGEAFEVEFVGARKESYSHDSRKPVIENGSLEDDQNRRDFTINAMAICLNASRFGELVDPFDGFYDLQDGIVRTPNDPDITFSDDPLRMLRCIRFATQLNFRIEEETFEALERNKERIKIISGERISTELNKILLSPVPSKGFVDLQRCGLLELILPELSVLDIVEVKNGRGHKNNFYHTLEVLDNVSLTSLTPGPSPKGEGSIKYKYKYTGVKTAHRDRYDLLKSFSKENRMEATDAENFLWEHIRNNALGEKFRRQHAIGDYIADFACLKYKLVIEVDGGYHNAMEQQQDDAQRTAWLEKQGFRVIRFTNEEILQDIDNTLKKIKDALKNPPLSFRRGAGGEASLWLRWAALLHDIGKTKSKRWEVPQGWTFHNHNLIGAKMVPGIFRRLALPLDMKMKYVQKLVDLHMRPIVIADEEVTDSAVRRLVNDAGDDIDDLMTLCEADITSKNEVRKAQFRENFRMVRLKIEDLKERDYKRLLQPVIDGNEIMEMFNLKPSREVGALKQCLKDAVLDGKVDNERGALMELLLQKAKAIGIVIATN